MMGFMDQFANAFRQTQQAAPYAQAPAQPMMVNNQAPQIQVDPIPQLPMRQPQYPTITAPSPTIDEEVFAPVQDSSEELFEKFKQNVLNPPQRTQMTYPPNILAGLTKALDVARTPTDYEKNRVFIGGNAYQKAKVFKDQEGKEHFVEPYKQPGFMQNVMQAMPEAVSVAPAIQNQKRADELADWDLQNKGISAAIGAQSQMELARQRGAQADWYGARPDIERDKLTIARLTAEERVRVSQLKTMTDRELELARQQGRLSLAEYNAVQAMKRVEAQQAGATERVGMQQTGATQRTAMTIEGNKVLEQIRQRGRIDLEDLRSLNDQELEQLRQDGRIDLESRRQINREINIRKQGEQNRETKAAPGAPGSSAGNYPTQQKQAAINKANEVLNAHPEWKDLITFDPQTGMPRLEEPSDPWFGAQDFTEYDKAYKELYGRDRNPAATGSTTTTPPATPTTPTTTTPPKASPNTTTPPGTPKVNPPRQQSAVPGALPQPDNVPIPPPTQPGVQPKLQRNRDTGQYRISYDGGKTWRDYNPQGKK